MPQGSKKPARSNNKKKKGGSGNKAASGASVSVESIRASAVGVPTNPYHQTVLTDGDINSGDVFPKREGTTRPLNPKDYQSIYVRYKDATRRFKEVLCSLVPGEIFQRNHVQCLVDAVDYLHHNHISNVPDSLIKNLKLAIRVRRQVTKIQYKGGDEGHTNFLSTLLYCFAVLRQLKPLVKKASAPSKAQEEEEPNENRFSALSMEYDDDDDDEADLPSHRVTKPLEPQKPSRRTLDELISGSDREAAILFLMTLDKIMSFNVLQYRGLKRAWASNKVNEQSPSCIVEYLLEASTVANLGIEYVHFLEQKLATDYPHMNTIYRVMAVLVLPELTEELSTEVNRELPIGMEFKEPDAMMFLGDCLEKVN